MEEDYGIDVDAARSAGNKYFEFLDEYEKKEQADGVIQQQQDAEDQQIKAELEDPRDANTWGAKALIKEGQSILSGGLQDTASSIATFGERTVDALSGEMQREKEEKGFYKPEWTPFDSYDNPIETKTWWGKQLRGLVHFGTLAIGTIAAAKAAAATGLVTIPAGLAGVASSSLARGAAIGAVSDLVSKESDEMNAMGALRERYGWFDTPLATKDTDHPVTVSYTHLTLPTSLAV